MTQFDRNQAEAFLKVIDPGAAGFTFQTFDDSPHKRPELARVFHASIDGAWDDLCRLSQRGAGVFVCVNETNFRGRKASDIVRVRALFADLDGAPLANAWDVPLTPRLDHPHQRGALPCVLACCRHRPRAIHAASKRDRRSDRW
jgi:hypothetical protein